jgi:hypothetical protein
MEKHERVVVALPLVCLSNKNKTVFVARIRALGLTAYADDFNKARLKAKQMFAKWVDLNRRSNTLEANLNRSGLTWYYESKYAGNMPYERFLPNGNLEAVTTRKENHWEDMKAMVVAC